MKWTIGIKLAILTLQVITAKNAYKQDNITNLSLIANRSNEFSSNVNIAPDDSKNDDETNNYEFTKENKVYGGVTIEEPVELHSNLNIERTDDDADLMFNDVVLTEYGPVMGHVENNIKSFFDIPYGKVEGIFQPPIKPDFREELHDKSFHDVKCPQVSFDGDVTLLGIEECLTLSVFTPIEAHNASVLFHIHDGNLKVGSGDPTHYGPENIVAKDVIVVLPNYRLGPLGFLCLGSDLAPGNAALKDLALALEWTVNNIENFGGNPANIVVSGEGTAGALAGFLALAEKSRHFVSKVITESGSFLSHLALDRSPHLTATELAQNLNKGNDSTTTEIIFDTALTELLIESTNITFRPCVEIRTDGFIIESPWKTLSKNIIDKKFMIGSANVAGYYEALKTLEQFESNGDWTQLIPEDLYFTDDSGDTTRHEIAGKIKNLYIDGNITGSDIETLTLYHTDASYLSPDIRSARALTHAGSTVYFYEFSYNGEAESESDPREVLGGALKGDTIGFLFSKSGVLPIENPNDEEMVATLTNLWASFIKTGIPASEGIAWSQLATTSEADEPWLSIGAVVVPETGVHINRLALWTQIYEDFYIDRSGVNKKQFDFPYVWVLLMCLIVFKN